MDHFLKLLDLTGEEITGLLELSVQLKEKQKRHTPHPYLAGKSVGFLFEKASTRTRVSFEVGVYQLGGHPLALSSKDMQIGRGEPMEDTARVLSRYLDGLLIRTYGQKEVEDLAKYGSIPIINGLTDLAHPCQVLADLLTVKERYGHLKGLKMCYVGDGNNMANSLIVGGLKTGMRVTAATPKSHRPDASVLSFASGFDTFSLTEDPFEAAKDADVVITDTWASMGQEEEKEERKRIFKIFQVNQELLCDANPTTMVLHCLPAYRGQEITDDVFEAHAKEIFDEAENRLHVQKAVMVELMGSGDGV